MSRADSENFAELIEPGPVYDGPSGNPFRIPRHIVVDGETVPMPPALAASLPTAAEEAPPGYVLRSLAWTDRLTAAELGGITLAASRGLEAGDPSLQVFLDTLGRATEVNVQDPRFVGALQAFAQAGLIDAKRLPELLAAAEPGEAP